MKRLLSAILSVIVILGAMRSYRLYQDSSPTPSEAVNDYLAHIARVSHSPQKIESLQVVSSTPSNRAGNEQVLLFQGNDRDLQTPMAGYATVKKSLFGWHVDKLQMVGKAPLPTDVMAGFDWSESMPIVFGQVFVADAASIEAVFSDPNQGDVTIGADLPKGNFAVFGTPNSEFNMLKILDVNGNVLKRLTNDELQNR